MTCTYCGSADHSVTRCPWKEITMRALILLPLLALTGCAGLNVSWQLNASYNTLSQTQSVVQHMPAREEAKPAAAPLPSGKPL